MLKKRRLNILAVSLIEIMVAMAIGSIILTSVFMVYYFTNKGNTVGFERMEAQQSLNTVIDILLKDLRTTGYKVSTDTCGILKDNSINKATRTELILFGDFNLYPTEDPKVTSTTLIERVHYTLVNNNTCLLRTLYQEEPDNTWTKKTVKVLIGNNAPNGKSRVCIGKQQNDEFGFCLKYFMADEFNTEIKPSAPGVQVTLSPDERQQIRKINISINITNTRGTGLSYAVTSTGLLRNLLTSE